MTRACLLLLLSIGCTTEPPEDVPAPPSEPVVIDLSNDVIIVQATCGAHCRYDDGDEVEAEIEAEVEVEADAAGDVVDVQDRCPDLPDDDAGDDDGCPEPAPAS